MKKILLPLVAMTAVLAPAMVHADETRTCQRLYRQVDPEFDESYTYTYDDLHRVVRIDQITDTDKLYFTYEYDTEGRCTKMTFHQFFDYLNKFYPTSYLEYKYNEAGQLIERSNFSNFDPGNPMSTFEPQATQYYAYNADGTLATMDQYLGTDLNNHALTQSYTYNDKGQLAELAQHTYANNSDMLSIYTYNEDGNLVETCEKVGENGRLDVQSYTNYVYENGNLVERYTTSASHNPANAQSRSLYIYDEAVPVADCIFPVGSPDKMFDNDAMTMSAHQVITAEDYIRAEDEMLNEHTWEYVYDPVEITGIASVTLPAEALAAATVNGDILTLHGVKAAGRVTVYDLEGRCVATAATTGRSINVGALDKGVYIVSTAAGAVKFVR